MKWISILLVLVLASGIFAQNGVKTVKSYMRGGIQAAPTDLVIGAKADGVDTTKAFYLGAVEGVVTAYFVTDTTSATSAGTGANESDSCMTINIQLKHAQPEAVWSEYAWKGTSTYTKLDTVARSIVNTSTTSGFYLPLGNENEYAPNDSVRFILQIGVGDSLYLRDLRLIGF